MNICVKCGFNQDIFSGTHAFICPDYDHSATDKDENGNLVPTDPAFNGFLLGISDRAGIAIDTFLFSLFERKLLAPGEKKLTDADIGEIIATAVTSSIAASIQVFIEQDLIDGEKWDAYFSSNALPEEF